MRSGRRGIGLAKDILLILPESVDVLGEADGRRRVECLLHVRKGDTSRRFNVDQWDLRRGSVLAQPDYSLSRS